jgi:hypothetical protein
MILQPAPHVSPDHATPLRYTCARLFESLACGS